MTCTVNEGDTVMFGSEIGLVREIQDTRVCVQWFHRLEELPYCFRVKLHAKDVVLGSDYNRKWMDIKDFSRIVYVYSVAQCDATTIPIAHLAELLTEYEFICRNQLFDGSKMHPINDFRGPITLSWTAKTPDKKSLRIDFKEHAEFSFLEDEEIPFTAYEVPDSPISAAWDAFSEETVNSVYMSSDFNSEEERLFEQGLLLYGGDIDAISSIIPSKSIDHVKSYADTIVEGCPATYGPTRRPHEEAVLLKVRYTMFRNRLETYLKKHKINQKQLSQRIGVAPCTISRLFTKKNFFFSDASSAAIGRFIVSEMGDE